MVGIYITFIFLTICILFILYNKQSKKENRNSFTDVMKNPDDCCGAHEVCEKEKTWESGNIIEYYDDEELDIFAQKPADEYTNEEIQQFCEIFYTLQEYDINGWLKSLQNRNIELPNELRDEVLLVIREQRFKKNN